MFEEAAAREGVVGGDDAEGAGGVEVLADVGAGEGEEGAAEGLAELGGVVVGGVGDGVGLGGGGGGKGRQRKGASESARGKDSAEKEGGGWGMLSHFSEGDYSRKKVLLFARGGGGGRVCGRGRRQAALGETHSQAALGNDKGGDGRRSPCPLS